VVKINQQCTHTLASLGHGKENYLTTFWSEEKLTPAEFFRLISAIY
jgi:hypothetical protein